MAADAISDYMEVNLLNLIDGTQSAIAATWAKLYTGDPGEDGLSNAYADDTNRKQIVTWNAASPGTPSSKSNVTVLTWASLGGTPGVQVTISHIGLWTANAAGNFLWKVPLTVPRICYPGDTFEIASGSLILTIGD